MAFASGDFHNIALSTNAVNTFFKFFFQIPAEEVAFPLSVRLWKKDSFALTGTYYTRSILLLQVLFLFFYFFLHPHGLRALRRPAGTCSAVLTSGLSAALRPEKTGRPYSRTAAKKEDVTRHVPFVHHCFSTRYLKLSMTGRSSALPSCTSSVRSAWTMIAISSLFFWIRQP